MVFFPASCKEVVLDETSHSRETFDCHVMSVKFPSSWEISHDAATPTVRALFGVERPSELELARWLHRAAMPANIVNGVLCRICMFTLFLFLGVFYATCVQLFDATGYALQVGATTPHLH